ncbi:MAG: hypothetical protein KAR06_08775, partial [Deltaproteobacteria bacterium]|nr:hypothetical protein [Deltaproteobacteria bacterium]
YPNVGMCVPITVTRDAPPSLDEPVALRDMTRREGWAFTIRRDIVADNPIPTELKIWYGDDFLYTLAGNRGYDRVMMVNNPVFHYGSVTMNKEFPPGSPRRQELVDEGHAYSSL